MRADERRVGGDDVCRRDDVAVAVGERDVAIVRLTEKDFYASSKKISTRRDKFSFDWKSLDEEFSMIFWHTIAEKKEKKGNFEHVGPANQQT